MRNSKLEVLKKYFGYDSFREGQEILIDGILKGQDVLGIMPTGAGKSLCYQIPALILPGITLVISPLISLMKDQVRTLNNAGVHAAYINSSLTENQINMAMKNAIKGQYKIIYVAPERLETSIFKQFARSVDISMVTVDEAHCISQWGQDFRPSYLNIVKLIETLPKRPMVSAFTATATENVKDDIVCVLRLNQPVTLVTGFNRENLYFEVNESKNKTDKLFEYIHIHKDESGIIYCATRKNVEKVYELLDAQGISVTKYHAGLTAEERKMNQDAFIYDEKPLIVATNAFGMGIDKSNVRFVIHYNMPQSMENYYQEAGRAGRDGEKSDCILLYSPQDVMINQFLIDNKEVKSDMSYEENMEVRERDMERLRQMTYYCTTKDCLREYILHYFGEHMGCSCGNCSNCLSEYEELDVTDICKNIIGCIDEVRGRYGINVIVGVLRGERKAKLTSYGLDTNFYYGAEKGRTEKQLKQIINELVMQEYLYVTKDKYAILKAKSKADDIQQGKVSIRIKVSKSKENIDNVYRNGEFDETAQEGRKKKERKSARTSDILNSRGLELLDELKKLRLTLAKEEGMPPYIVFSDKTLVDMCMKLPFTKHDMMDVNGIGENKFEKYGQQFLAALSEFTNGRREKLYFGETIPVQEQETTEKRKRKNREQKSEFYLTEETAQEIFYTPECLITEFAGQINELIDTTVMKRTSGAAIVRKFKEVQLLDEVYVNGVWRKKLFDKGADFGIIIKNRVSAKGTEYEVWALSEQGQRNLVQKMLGEWNDIR